jgi:hypothetical protein
MVGKIEFNSFELRSKIESFFIEQISLLTIILKEKGQDRVRELLPILNAIIEILALSRLSTDFEVAKVELIKKEFRDSKWKLLSLRLAIITLSRHFWNCFFRSILVVSKK